MRKIGSDGTPPREPEMQHLILVLSVVPFTSEQSVYLFNFAEAGDALNTARCNATIARLLVQLSPSSGSARHAMQRR